MNADELTKLAEIHRLLDEAYRHYFENSDGYCKSAEGHVSIELGNYWERRDDGLHVTAVSIYSYVLGPARSHDFDNLDQALEVVRSWHKREMATTYENGDVIDEPEDEDLYGAIEADRDRKCAEVFAAMDLEIGGAS